MITRKSLVLATATILGSAAAITLAQTSAKPVLRSAVFNWDGFNAQPTKTGSRRQCFDAPTATLERLECHVTTLNPGEAPHAGHHHPEEEVIIVKAGALEAVQNGQTNLVEAGGIIFEASNEPHSLRNPGTDQAVYYVLKVYPHDLSKADSHCFERGDANLSRFKSNEPRLTPREAAEKFFWKFCSLD